MNQLIETEFFLFLFFLGFGGLPLRFSKGFLSKILVIVSVGLDSIFICSSLRLSIVSCSLALLRARACAFASRTHVSIGESRCVALPNIPKYGSTIRNRLGVRRTGVPYQDIVLFSPIR